MALRYTHITKFGYFLHRRRENEPRMAPRSSAILIFHRRDDLDELMLERLGHMKDIGDSQLL